MNNLIIVDGRNVCYRAWYAHGPGSKTPQAKPLEYGMLAALDALLLQFPCTHLAIADDPLVGGGTWRHRLFPAYKGTRNKDNLEAFYDELPTAYIAVENKYKRLIIRRDAVEADDVIGTLARDAGLLGLNSFIFSNDKDFAQLIRETEPQIGLLRPEKGETHIRGDAWTREKFGVGPDHIVDFLAILGDAADNVPGVKGIGAIGAAEIVSTYGTVNQIYAALERGEVSPKYADKLQAGRADAFLSLRLVRIDTSLALGITLTDLEFNQ